ncbi:MAG: phosphohistidine phosphatase SixA [Methanolinea sp.]
MDLYIVRHGKAGKRVGDPSADSGRTLTKGGRKEVRAVAKWLSATAPPPDWIATSPLPRARETAEIVAGKWGIPGEVEEWDELFPGHEPSAVLSRVSRMPAGSTGAIVGHEPQLSGILSLLACGNWTLRVALAKGGVARVAGIDPDGGTSGTLEWLVSPSLLCGG